ncbi:bifunctional DNA primase/polymerase [Mesorhizobium sp. IMUNJ 23232]|uniref:bifunctional DNA primase/polymerase n=1 Tax=Mesorhizobium sp. IMUNJ 23232 TaxID=3376064 RepID=UPI0037A2E59C
MSFTRAAAEPEPWQINPATLVEMRRCYNLGFSLVPLSGDAERAKKPTLKFRDRALPFDVVVRQMIKERSNAFGIRLAGLIVIDDDTGTPESEKFIRDAFGQVSTYQVATKRGVQHYFRRGTDPRPKNIRLPGVAIDFKTGENEFVVAAGSIRADGVAYRAVVGRLESVDKLPVFMDWRTEAEMASHVDDEERRRRPSSGKIANGGRNDFLFRRGLQYARTVDTVDDLIGNLLKDRDIHCDEPADVEDAEVENTARSVWRYKEEGILFSRDNSTYRMPREATKRLLEIPGGEDALSLLSVLQMQHGHLAGYLFMIIADSMQGRCLPFGQKRIRRAIDVLISENLLVRHDRTGTHRAHWYSLPYGEDHPPAPSRGRHRNDPLRGGGC